MKKETLAEWNVHESDNRVIWMEPIKSSGLPPAIQRREKNFPAGTKITITAEIPEQPKERVVLPEGMAWNGLAILWTAEGLEIAKAFTDRDGWYRVPFMVSTVSVEKQATLEATKQHIENALAEHGYFGVKKVVDNVQ